MKSKKQKKAQKNKEQIDDKLQDEIMSYLSKNETLLKTENESEKEMKQIKEENDKYLQEIKSKSTDEIFDEIVKALNNTMQLEKEAQESQDKIAIENENIKTYYLNAQTVDKQYNELDAYNKTILQKIKEISQDKIKIAELEVKKKLQNKDYTSPTLEKQMVCVCTGTSYTIEELKEITMRKLSYLLRVVDRKLSYQIQMTAAMSGFVQMKEDPTHWIFGDQSYNIAKELTDAEEFTKRFERVT